MTRNEQIREAANNLSKNHPGIKAWMDMAFEQGANWADNNPKSPWIPLDGKHKEPPYGRAILVYYPIGNGEVDLVERSKITGSPDKYGNYFDLGNRKHNDEYGLPVQAETSRAAMLCSYRVRATLYMDIPDPQPTKEDNI